MKSLGPQFRAFASILLLSLPLPGLAQNLLYQVDSSFAPSSHKVSFSQVLFSGSIQTTPSDKGWMYIPGLINLVQYNTVEGLVISPSLSYTRPLPRKRFFNVKPSIRYGIGNQRLNAQLKALYFYNAQDFSYVQLSGGRYMQEINDVSALEGWGSTFNILTARRNFFKLYEATFLNLTHVSAPYKDLLFTTALHWEDRNPLENLPRFDDGRGRFTPNPPENEQLANTQFSSHQVFLWRAQFTWQKDQAYTRQNGKFISTGMAPAFTLAFTTTLSDLLGTDLSYQKLSLRIQDRYQTPTAGQGQIMLEAGDFLNRDSLSFVDYHHFNGNLSLYNSFQLNGFQLLDYYQFSNADFYLQGHLQHTFPSVTRGRKVRTIDPVFSAHYLYTEAVSHLELGLGAEKIFKNWRVECYGSFRDGQFDRIGTRFGLLF